MLIVKLMKIVLLISIFLAVFFPVYINVSVFAAVTKDLSDESLLTDSSMAGEVLMPSMIEHEGTIYVRDAYRKEYEQAVYADLDGDGSEELVLRFRANAEHGYPVAITAIFGSDKGSKIVAKAILGGETPNGMELSDIDKDDAKDLILYDHAGNHYTVIMIYSFKDGAYRCLFENGTACYVHKVDTGTDPVRITIGRENRQKEGFCYANSDTESLLEVWEWSGKEFAYSPSLSTTPPISEKEAIEITWQNMKKFMEEASKETDGPEQGSDVSDSEFLAKGWVAGRRAFELFRDEISEIYPEAPDR